MARTDFSPGAARRVARLQVPGRGAPPRLADLRALGEACETLRCGRSGLISAVRVTPVRREALDALAVDGAFRLDIVATSAEGSLTVRISRRGGDGPARP